jgi:hypothetical protein
MPGRLAQRKSSRLTTGRSLVRAQYRPPGTDHEPSLPVCGNGTGRAATRGGSEVIELEYGITVYHGHGVFVLCGGVFLMSFSLDRVAGWASACPRDAYWT